MAKIKKIQESGQTIYPATIFQAIKNPKNGQTLEKSFESEHKKLTAGFAYEVLGDGQATSEKFSFRPTGGLNRNVRDGSARIEVLKGNSVVANQHVIYSSIPQTTNGVTFTPNLENGTVRATGIPNGVVLYGIKAIKWNNNEKFFVLFIGDGGGPYPTGNTITDQGTQKDAGGGTIWTPQSYWNENGFIPVLRLGTNYFDQEIDFTFKPIIINLTQMFGADIANTITKPEQFYELLPEGVDINAYNGGEIVDANYKSIKTTGFNQYNGTYAKVLGGVKYYLGGTYTSIGYTTEEGGTTEAITIPSDKFYTPSQNGYIYAQGTDICINIAWDEYSALNGKYKPYKPFERDLSWVNKYFPNGMRSAGNVADEIRFNSTTQQWEAVQRVGVRAYQSGDEADTAVTTDGKNTNYALATPDVQTITEDVNLAYDVADYGTEQLIVADGTQSAPLSAKVVYEPNVLASIKQVAAMLTRLDALETAVATMQASAVATTNEE